MDSGSFKLIKLFNIDIEIHWTFALILVLLLLFGFYSFFLLIVLLFICVLIHELAHSITAIRNNVKVSKIILLPIGGASIIDDLKLNPLIEFNVSIVGPFTSLLLSGLFGILAILSPAGYFVQMFQELFVLNLLLGLSNLLPAFPMDGGRVLRSYIQKNHSLYDATMTTLKISKYTLLLIAIGTFAFVLLPSNYSSDYKQTVVIWNMIIIYFLYSSMKAEEDNVIIRKATQNLTIKEIITNDFAIMDKNSKIEILYKIIKDTKKHIILTKTDTGFGVVDISKVNKAKNNQSAENLIVPIITLPNNINVVDALYKIENSNIGVAAVVNKKKLIGIVTVQHLSTFISLHMLTIKNRKGFNS